MLSEENTRAWVHLYGGEQDGYRCTIAMRGTPPPRKFFIWHCKDQPRIDAAKGKNLVMLRSKLAVMAYELFAAEEIAGNEIEYRYRRCESADKVAADPV